VVQYRNRILPLARLDSLLGLPVEDDGELLQVVVQRGEGHDLGLVVGHIVDIVEENITDLQKSSTPGILGSAIIHGHITDLIDTDNVLRTFSRLQQGDQFMQERDHE
jgi:two-component system, chemotaxis family, sensor kinase CheA